MRMQYLSFYHVPTVEFEEKNYRYEIRRTNGGEKEVNGRKRWTGIGIVKGSLYIRLTFWLK
jgi:hypothetical protein